MFLLIKFLLALVRDTPSHISAAAFWPPAFAAFNALKSCKTRFLKRRVAQQEPTKDTCVFKKEVM